MRDVTMVTAGATTAATETCSTTAAALVGTTAETAIAMDVVRDATMTGPATTMI